MIKISVSRDEVRGINCIIVKGHAEYAAYGKDIVCAAVSSLVICLFNFISFKFGLECFSYGKNQIIGKIPFLTDKSLSSDLQLILEALVFSLKMIAEKYPKNVTFVEVTN